MNKTEKEVKFDFQSKRKEHKTMKFKDRFKAIRLARGYTMKQVEEMAGLKGGNISRIEKGLQWVNEDTLYRLADALGVHASRFFIDDEEKKKDSRYITFQQIDINASAGSGSFNDDFPEVLREISVLETWARQMLGIVDPSRVRIITCKGDSMMPTIKPGDIVFVDISVRQFEAEGIYVLSWQGHLLLKRLNAMFDGSGRLAIQSDNEANYKTEYVTPAQADQLQVNGKVLAWWTLRKT